VATPLSNSPPQGGREQAVRVASATMDSIVKQPNPSLRANGSRECAPDDRLREAIHLSFAAAMDCFAALAMTSKHTFTTSPRHAPEPLMNLPPLRGRGERRMPNAPAASCALVLVERTRVTTSTPESPGIPARNGFNGFLRALPGDRALLPPSLSGLRLCPRPVGPTNLRELDASIGASGPHDFAVRCNISRPLAVDRSQAFRQPALQSRRAQNAAASTASAPRVRDDHDTPLWWGGMARICRDDLPDG
jgi:hypothetical protein